MFFSTTCLLLAMFPAAGLPDKYPQSNLLLEPPELAQWIKQKQSVVILDARPKKEYEAGHVPGAYWVDAAKWAKTFHTSRAADTWGPLLSEVGVRPNVPIVVYDNSKAKDAARIWWILRYWGFDKGELLNGGWTGWQAGKNAITKEEPAIPIKFALTLKPKESVYAGKQDVLKNLKSKTAQLLDARSEGEYCGDVKFAKKGGAIPGAVHLEWSDALDPKTQRFKSASELAKLLKDKGIDLKEPIITHCQSGGRAAVQAFTLELMGAKNVSNYYNGWSEWGNAPDTPIVTPKKK